MFILTASRLEAIAIRLEAIDHYSLIMAHQNKVQTTSSCLTGKHDSPGPGVVFIEPEPHREVSKNIKKTPGKIQICLARPGCTFFEDHFNIHRPRMPKVSL